MDKRSKWTLTPRLQLLADWVPQGTRLADIGTDHGYLPVWLTLHGRISSAIAGDLRAGPLAHARATADEWSVSERIDFRLCDGLSAISPSEVDTVVIAGMGGENIAAILRSAPWTQDGRHLLLLQPMSRAEELRAFLSESGYAIRREQLVRDRGVLYPVMMAEAGTMQLSLGQLYGGAALLRDPLEDRYLIEWILRQQGAIAGLNRSASPEDQVRADELRESITALMRMREEWRNANCSPN